MNGDHDRQEQFMKGEPVGAAWDEDDQELAAIVARGNSDDDSDDENASTSDAGAEGGREKTWESGKGRCPVTGRRVLGGTDGLRRVLI